MTEPSQRSRRSAPAPTQADSPHPDYAPTGPPDYGWGLPERFLQYGLDAFSPASVEPVREFLRGSAGWCLYLYGETGSRKTSLAVAALVEARRGGAPAIHWGLSTRRGLFVPAYYLVRRLRDVKSPSAHATIRNLAQTCLLVLDDIGKHRDTPHVVEQLGFLLHERYNENRLTIFTANVTVDDLAQRLDDSTARRIAEGCIVKMELPK